MGEYPGQVEHVASYSTPGKEPQQGG